MVVLGVDWGRRRIGLAISDPSGAVALPSGTLESAGLERDVATLRDLVCQRGVERIVVGLPVHMSGREGPEAAAVRRFARRLEEKTGRPVALLDERWTTLEAERALAEVGGRRRRRKGQLDEAAATILLRTYLERERRA